MPDAEVEVLRSLVYTKEKNDRQPVIACLMDGLSNRLNAFRDVVDLNSRTNAVEKGSVPSVAIQRMQRLLSTKNAGASIWLGKRYNGPKIASVDCAGSVSLEG